jgi:3-oxoacyl-[acyl-carrier-protein] synthase II
VEEAAFLAAAEALAAGRLAAGEATGVSLGIDVAIDGIKAAYWRAVLSDGPLGASPLHFPFTAPNTVAAQLTILLGLAGESTTVCGGSVSGAQAIGLAAEAVREGRCAAVLAGGAGSVGAERIEEDGTDSGGWDGTERSAAAFLLLAAADGGDALAEVAGYAEGRGPKGPAEAAARCLAAAGIAPRDVARVVAAGSGAERIAAGAAEAGIDAPVVSAPLPGLVEAAFPAAAAAGAASGPWPLLVVADDPVSGSAALLLVRGGRR